LIMSTVLLGIAVAHVVWPSLAIDALSLGLLGAAIVVIFFDIESFEWQGIKARRLQQEVKEAEKVVDSIHVPQITPALPDPTTEPSSLIVRATSVLEAVHEEPFDLMPPVDRLERLLWGAEQIRAELIIIAGNGGQLPERTSWDRYRSPELAEILAGKDMIPHALVEPVLTVVQLRNSVVHTTRRLPTDLLESASRLAMDVLVKLRQVKRNYIRVRVPNVMLFRDQSLTARYDVAGVMLAQLDDEGAVRHIAVYPRLPNYQMGRFVSWEWSRDPTIRTEAWYHDPRTNRPAPAFRQSMTFVGREYPQQWGIEYRFPRPDVGFVEGDAA